MTKDEFPYAIAISGGIATGKSTLKSLLFLEGFAIIESDEIAHQILDESISFISESFGDEFIDGGKVNRARLGKVIFSDEKQKKILENYIHPKIRNEIKRLATKLELKKFPYLIDIPLYFEYSSYDLKRCIVVYTDYATQTQRLMKRNNFSKSEATLRINAQMHIEEKKKLADYVVDNSKNLKHLQKQCDLLIKYIKETSINTKQINNIIL